MSVLLNADDLDRVKNLVPDFEQYGKYIAELKKRNPEMIAKFEEACTHLGGLRESKVLSEQIDTVNLLVEILNCEDVAVGLAMGS